MSEALGRVHPLRRAAHGSARAILIYPGARLHAAAPLALSVCAPCGRSAGAESARREGHWRVGSSTDCPAQGVYRVLPSASFAHITCHHTPPAPATNRARSTSSPRLRQAPANPRRHKPRPAHHSSSQMLPQAKGPVGKLRFPTGPLSLSKNPGERGPQLSRASIEPGGVYAGFAVISPEGSLLPCPPTSPPGKRAGRKAPLPDRPSCTCSPCSLTLARRAGAAPPPAPRRPRISPARRPHVRAPCPRPCAPSTRRRRPLCRATRPGRG